MSSVKYQGSPLDSATAWSMIEKLREVRKLVSEVILEIEQNSSPHAQQDLVPLLVRMKVWSRAVEVELRNLGKLADQWSQTNEERDPHEELGI